MEIDHGFCRSVYTIDPNHILVEFCCTTRAFSAAEVAGAIALVADRARPGDTSRARFFEPLGERVP
jgi:hypothetical protein